ncbi:hypothetical protein Tco_0645897 [Tanacetum coccineum]
MILLSSLLFSNTIIEFSLFLAFEIEIVSALLIVEDDEFWLDISLVEFRELPALQDAATVVGYPIGGT